MSLRPLLPAAALLSATLAGAQSLEKEITIDRDIVPAQRAARRPLVFPALAAPRVNPVNLSMEAAPSAVSLQPGIQPFNPAATPEAFAPTPWRGYVDLGYFPTAEIGVSAGYTLLHSSKTRLNLWLQASNSRFKSKSDLAPETGSEYPGWDKLTWQSLDFAAGIDLSQKFGRSNTLTVSAEATISSWNMPDLWEAAGMLMADESLAGRTSDPNNRRFRLTAGFDGRNTQGLSYSIGASFGFYKNKKAGESLLINRKPDLVAGIADAYSGLLSGDILPSDNETSWTFDASLRKALGGNVGVAMKVEGDFRRYSSFLTPAMAFGGDFSSVVLPKAKTLGQIDFIPSVDYTNGVVYGRAGARLGVSMNSGKTFHVAPDVLLGINPSTFFGAWVRLEGGVTPNSLESLFMESRYADPRLAYNMSNLAFTGQAGVRVGPFKGASLTFTADYAAANNWLMPLQVLTKDAVDNIFHAADQRAWKLGVRADWQYRSLLAVSVSYEASLGSADKKAWIYWRDRARSVVDASLSVSPIEPLSVEVGFTGRFDRRQSAVNIVEVERYINDQDYYATPVGSNLGYKLGDCLDLRAGASWRFSPELSVFARFSNILNRHDRTIFNAPTTGLTGLFGVAYKF